MRMLAWRTLDPGTAECRGAETIDPENGRMAKLYFYYSTMNAGKSTALLQAAYNYAERGMRSVLCSANFDAQQRGQISSRIGITSVAHHFGPQTDFWNLCLPHAPHCVLVDEA